MSRLVLRKAWITIVLCLVWHTGCAVPVAFFLAPAKGSAQRIIFVDDAGVTVRADGLLLVRRIRHSGRDERPRVFAKVLEIRQGQVTLPDEWVFAYLRVGLHPMRPYLPCGEICPMEEGGIQPFIPGYYAYVPFSELEVGRVKLKIVSENAKNAREFWEDTVRNLYATPAGQLVANQAELDNLSEFMRKNWTPTSASSKK